MRIAWYSNSPTTSTGYGTQTRQMLPRLVADGHRVAVLGNYGHVATVMAYGTPEGEVPVFPSGHAHYALDVAGDQAKAWFGADPGWVISLYDTWVFPASLWAGMNVISWTPIDHTPVTPGIAKWCASHKSIAMSRFGQNVLAEAGITAPYIPHGIEKDIWHPRQSDVRAQMGLPDDAFVVMMNAANIKAPHVDRKAWDANLRAFGAFAREHSDAYLFLNTDPARPGGFPIPSFLKFVGVPEAQTRITDVTAYRNGLITSETIAELYTAADVLLSCSMGEGFGLPVAEAMACGTPAIVSDFSAQPELVGETGWKVPTLPYYDENQKADFAWPDCYNILEALEEAYAEKGTSQATARSAAAEAHIRAEYDADTVYAEKWRPLLASLQGELAPRRKGMSKSAQRRKKAA